MTYVSNDPALWPLIYWARITNYFVVVSSTAVVYDWSLTFGQEFELVWRRRWSLMTVLYVCVRCLGILYSVVNGLSILPFSITDKRSRMMLIFLTVVLLTTTIASGVITVIANIGVSGVEKVLSGIPQCGIYINADNVRLNDETLIPTAVWEILALFLAAWIVIKHFRELRRSPTGLTIRDCFTVLIRSHVLYFVA
ncbi:hypothetical protein DFH29DRAFT_1008665 [Suillus ampliporus]|nr:hypothetical protein DFH29DRAFT_1008665 [Suillus ampliporus]